VVKGAVPGNREPAQPILLRPSSSKKPPAQKRYRGEKKAESKGKGDTWNARKGACTSKKAGSERREGNG